MSWTSASYLAFKQPHFSGTATHSSSPELLRMGSLPRGFAPKIHPPKTTPRGPPPAPTESAATDKAPNSRLCLTLPTGWDREILGCRQRRLSTETRRIRLYWSKTPAVLVRQSTWTPPPSLGGAAGNARPVSQYAEIIKHGGKPDQHFETNVHRDKSKWSEVEYLFTSENVYTTMSAIG